MTFVANSIFRFRSVGIASDPRVSTGTETKRRDESSRHVSRTHLLPAIRTVQARHHHLVAAAVPILDWGSVLVSHPAIPPIGQGEENGIEVDAALGEAILIAGRLLLVGHALEDFVGD